MEKLLVSQGGDGKRKRSRVISLVLGALVGAVLVAFVVSGIWLKAKRGWILNPPQAESVGQTWTDPGVGMRFRYLPAGKFAMGSPLGEANRDTNETQHRVKLTRAYWMGETEVTQEQWRVVMGSNPSRFSACGDDCPVENVNWCDAIEYANRLSRMAGLEECYVVSGRSVTFAGLGCKGYRLPTEAEWEYAARAGGSHLYSGGDDLGALGWYDGNAVGTTHRVGQKRVNAWGLYDMSGNVWEWCWDKRPDGDYPRGSVTNPVIDTRGSERVLRGGGWDTWYGYCRSAFRFAWQPCSGAIFGNYGFRLVRTAE